MAHQLQPVVLVLQPLSRRLRCVLVGRYSRRLQAAVGGVEEGGCVGERGCLFVFCCIQLLQV